jgi:8-oxo-dGTP diphosphatase
MSLQAQSKITKPQIRFRFRQDAPLSTTDSIIEYNHGGEEGLILIERGFEPYGIAIPGGKAELWISFEENNAKETKEETDLGLILYNAEHPLSVRSDPKRDPRGHLTANVYVGRGIGTPKAGDDAKRVMFYPLPELDILVHQTEKWAFEDHPIMVREYLDRRRSLEEQLRCYAAGKPMNGLPKYCFFGAEEIAAYKRRLGITRQIAYDGVLI